MGRNHFGSPQQQPAVVAAVDEVVQARVVAPHGQVDHLHAALLVEHRVAGVRPVVHKTKPGLSAACRATGSNAETKPAMVRCRIGALCSETLTWASCAIGLTGQSWRAYV